MRRRLPQPFEPATIAYNFRKPDLWAMAEQAAAENSGIDQLHGLEALVAQKLDEQREAQIGAAAIGLTTAFDFLDAYSKVDQSFLCAASDLFNRQMATMADLAQRLETASLGSSFADALKGRLAERVLFDRLERLGIHAEMAQSFNQAGWDLTIGGVPVNSKLVADAASLSTHFAKYPDIPAVIPGDAANIPAYAVHFDSLTGHGMSGLQEVLSQGHERLVLVDDAANHAEIGNRTNDALTTTTNPEATIKYRFPWITLILSGWREAQLLDKGHTDLGTSLRNITLDVAGTSLGGWGGAKAGAFVGSVFGPAGTVLGGILGGIGGAIFGRSVTTEIKCEDFKAAHAAYEKAYQAYTDAIADENKCITERLDGARRCEEKILADEAAAAQARLEELMHDFKLAGEAATRIEPAEAKTFLTTISGLLATRREDLKAERTQRSWWRRWIWPDATILGCEEGCRVIDAALAHLDELAAQSAGQPLNRASVYTYLGMLGFGEFEVRAALGKIDADRAEREGQIQRFAEQAVARLLALRRQAMERLKVVAEETVTSAQENLLPLISAAKSAQRCAVREARKLGAT
jgi:hypothetical protein